jgi:hypothetical protein
MTLPHEHTADHLRIAFEPDSFVDPVSVLHHRDWQSHRYEAHVEDALAYHRRARRHLRHGYINLANDNLRNALRCIRMAKHFRKEMGL